MANRDDIARAEAGYEVWNAWANEELKKPPLERARTDFSGETLDINFSAYVFPSYCDFSNVTFNRTAWFTWAKFRGWADFSGAVFHNQADFAGCRFEYIAKFSDGKFHGVTNFDNAVFQYPTFFAGRQFNRAPSFQNATLHQGTTFSSGDGLWDQFPDIKSERAEQNYRTLKLAMSGFQAHREEMFFFAREMQSRAFREPWHKKWLYTVYDAVSQYGHNIARPLLTLLFLYFPFFILYRELVRQGTRVPLGDSELWYATAAHSVPLPGLFSRIDDAEKIVFGPDISLGIGLLMTVHTLSSMALIFLALLAVRNRFRIR